MPSPFFTVSLSTPGASCQAKGKTIGEALAKLKPSFVKYRGVFTVKQGKKQAQRMMFPMPIKQLLVNKTAQQIFEKRMLLVLK